MSLLPTLIASAAIPVLAGLAVRFSRRASAARRHMIWAAALVSLLLVPAFSVVLPVWEVTVLPAEPAAVAQTTDSRVRTAVPAATVRSLLDWLPWIWLAGAALATLRLGLGILSMQRRTHPVLLSDSQYPSPSLIDE